MKKFAGFAGAIAAVWLSSEAMAHDFFLMPSQFTATQSGPLGLQASVGSSFPQPTTAVTPDRVAQLFVHGAGKPQLAIVGLGEKALNLQLTAAGAGTVVAGIKTLDRDVEYSEDRIPLILEEYRVSPKALAAIEKLDKPRTLKVSSRRFAKTMLCVRQCDGSGSAARPMGVALEFIASGSSNNHFRLLSLGRSLTNYPVDLVNADGKRTHLMTDNKGEVHLASDARGSLMLFAAVMTPPVKAVRFVLNLSTLTFSRP